MKKILIVEDDKVHRNMLVINLKNCGFDVTEAGNGVEAISLCKKELPDLLLLDLKMPKKDGMETLEEVKKLWPALPVVMITAFSDISSAVKAIRAGAYDYLAKPLDWNKVEITLKHALSEIELKKENSNLLNKLKNENLIVSASPLMQNLKEMISAIAPTDATVLITGESGTGKELAAKEVHNKSKRAQNPFIAINCGALTESLLTSELFGYEKGAFTGANQKRKGLFQEAENGTIFLDEIGEIPLSMQVKLLRVLQEKEVLSVGAQKASPINCRIIAATNRNLEQEVANGNFRKDLYYRLNVMNLTIPALRERKEDIPLLCRHFADKFAYNYDKIPVEIDSGALTVLCDYSWPGNVRELENVMERAVILMSNNTIQSRHLPERITKSANSLNNYPDELSEVQKNLKNASGVNIGQTNLNEVEKSVILKMLEQCNNNKTEAAKALGISRKTLYAKLEKYGRNQ